MVSGFKLLSKKGDGVSLGFEKDTELRIGDCLKVCDDSMEVVVQAYDLRYGGLGKAVGDFISRLGGAGSEEKSFIARHARAFSETRVAMCKIRGVLEGGRFSTGLMKLPNQITRIERMGETEVLEMLALSPKRPAVIGRLYGSGTELSIDLAGLQGVSLITGRKGSGKSHLAKKLLEQIIENGAPAVVLDVNGEYSNLKEGKAGSESSISGKISELVPGNNFFIPLDGISFETFCRMCQIEENHNSFRLFARYWSETGKGKGLQHLKKWVQSSSSPPGSVNAAMARIDYADSLGVFGEFDFAARLESVRAGGAVVLNLFRQGEKAKQLSIVYVLRQLIALGLADRGRIFLFAEEAQNYFEKEFWDDIITRMRHLGIYSIIVTNEPTTLPDMVFRQCDNLFCFNFSSASDIAFVSNAQVIDPDSLSLVKNLGVGQCAAIGKCTNGFPLVVEVSATNAKAGGETKVLW